MTTDFQFDVTRQIDPYVLVEGPMDSEQATAPESKHCPVVKAGSDAARIAEAIARLMQWSKESDAHPHYGGHHSPDYYKEIAGEGTSEFEFDIVGCALGLLDDPTGWNLFFNGGEYDHKTGAWVRKPDPSSVPVSVITISDLKAKLDMHIREHGLSEVLIWEFLADPHSRARNEQAWRRLPLEEKIKCFRKQDQEN